MEKKKSFNALNKIYFFTATIHKWLPLLNGDERKDLIIEYLKKLSDENYLIIYAFVIMPNHIHIIWRQLNLNGKETPQASFLKYTAHEFLKQLKKDGKCGDHKVTAPNKKYEIWQRDSLSIEIYTGSVAAQKLNYIHFNPVSRKWKLSKDDLDYHYSSARFYEYGKDDFGFLKNLYKVFDGL